LFEICHEVVINLKTKETKTTLIRGVKVRLKNKGKKNRDHGGSKPKVEAPFPEHPETKQNLKDSDIQANRLEAFNGGLRRKLTCFLRRTNFYAKQTSRLQQRLDLHWILHNFVWSHFTTKQVPAVHLGILEEPLNFMDLLKVKYQ
jgi:hypothetical protein